MKRHPGIISLLGKLAITNMSQHQRVGRRVKAEEENQRKKQKFSKE
jgi:hypothetical protein